MSKSTEYSSDEVRALVVGTLDPHSAARLRADAMHDPQLAAEIALWTAVRRELSETVANDASDELGWARLDRALTAREENTVANDNAGAGNRPFWQRRIIAPWQAAAAVVAGVMAWQFAAIPAIAPASDDQPSGYELAGDGAEAGHTLRIAFEPDATDKDMRAALRAARARIVDGPSAIGLYTIAFVDAKARSRGADILASRDGIVAEVAE